MAIEKISVKTLRQEVYDQLRDKIISAEILPGANHQPPGTGPEIRGEPDARARGLVAAQVGEDHRH